jgi:hypothetical protein
MPDRRFNVLLDAPGDFPNLKKSRSDDAEDADVDDV